MLLFKYLYITSKEFSMDIIRIGLELACGALTDILQTLLP